MYVECDNCSSKGYIACNQCMGKGLIKRPLSNVMGRGVRGFRLAYTENVSDTCPKCKGKGVVRCPFCKGKKVIFKPDKK